MRSPAKIPVVMYGIAGYALPFFENMKIDIRPARLPRVMKIVGVIP